jgi:hypothetical protein
MNLEKREVFPIIPFRKLQEIFRKPCTVEGFSEISELDFEVRNLYQLIKFG